MPAFHEVLKRAWEAGVAWDTRRALNGLAAIASLQAKSEIAATLTRLASLIAERSDHAPTRIEADIFLPLIAESTDRLTATDWQTHTSTARQLLDRGTIQGVTELILTLTEE